MAAWLLLHGKLTVPSTVPMAGLSVDGPGGRLPTCRVIDPEVLLADEPDGTDRFSGWIGEDDAAALAEHGTGPSGLTVRRLTIARVGPLAVQGGVRLVERDLPVRGWAFVALSWPAGLRGNADHATAGIIRHSLPYAAPGEDCRCVGQDCGGLVPLVWCPEHGTAAAPVLEWHPGGGIRCDDLARARTGPASADASVGRSAGVSPGRGGSADGAQRRPAVVPGQGLFSGAWPRVPHEPARRPPGPGGPCGRIAGRPPGAFTGDSVRCADRLFPGACGA